jgi:hypothetical protein
MDEELDVFFLNRLLAYGCFVARTVVSFVVCFNTSKPICEEKSSKLLLGVMMENAYSPGARYTGLENSKSVPVAAVVEVLMAEDRIVTSESGMYFDGCGYPLTTGFSTIETGVLVMESLLLKYSVIFLVNTPEG